MFAPIIALIGRLTDKVSARLLVLTVLICGGTLAYTRLAHNPGPVLLGASLLVRGLGMRGATVPAFTAMYYGLNKNAIPEATSARRVFQQIGAPFGTAVLAVILQRETDSHPGHLVNAFGSTFWWTLGLSALAVLPALLLPGRVHADGPESTVQVEAEAESEPQAPQRRTDCHQPLET